MALVGFGQDSHAFDKEQKEKRCVIGGVVIPNSPPFAADSDGDIVFHAICNAITSITHVPILGGKALKLCKQGVVDSFVYVQEAVQTLTLQRIIHVALSVEGKSPKLQPYSEEIRESVAKALAIGEGQVGLTMTSGDGLTPFGRGEGMQCLCLMTVA